MKCMQEDTKHGLSMFASISSHGIKNASFQRHLQLSDVVYGANRMMPPELLHTSDSGLIMHMQESLQCMIREGIVKIS